MDNIDLSLCSCFFRAAKNGKFDCTVMSLSVLLDYRPEDNKEHTFEVSVLLHVWFIFSI